MKIFVKYTITTLLSGVAALVFVLPPAAVQAQQASQASQPSLQKKIENLFSSPKEEKLLEPDLAFGIKTSFKGPNTLLVQLSPANGYYLYRDRIRFALKDAPGVRIESIKLPPGLVKQDPNFGKTETYAVPLTAEITLARTPTAKAMTLVASYQGCHANLGVCYPPIEKALKLNLQ